MKQESSASKSPHSAKINPLDRIRNNPALRVAIPIVVLALILVGAWYIYNVSSTVYIEKASIEAPVISINPLAPGVLEKVYVKEGDEVSPSKVLAIVGNTELHAKVHGIVIDVLNTPGQVVTSQNAIVTMIDPTELRVVAKVNEDKGLQYIRKGQRASFTVDAFGSKHYDGIVDSIGETSAQQDIVFSISSQRQEQGFNVYIRFDVNSYPELKNGMSAKVWVYK
jgi:multidrug resistance efflux pump